ncbi:MAG TPA: tripartite tricarboxylate transporter substrate-binding protein [Pseudolabrys sp.]|nr:tripartite tricarboxylate transporter substrate-binding protein [Pseudolabrys sp.]
MTFRVSTTSKWARALAGIAAAALLSVTLTPSPAQAKWPEKPVKLVLPFGPGGVADVTARILADRLSKKFGQQVIVENMPGPGGINAARTVVQAPPDGYTMGLVTNGTAISVVAFNHLPFDPTQFQMVSTIGLFDLVFAVKGDSPYKSLKDFITAAKASAGKLNIATITVGGTQNLGAELFKSSADLNVVIVPYKNSPDVVVSVLRNDAQMLVEFPPAVAGQVKDGKLRILAISSTKRSPLEPKIPTVAESGVPGFEVTSWNGIFAPKGTPKAVVETMNAAIREVVAMPDVKAAYAKVGVIAQASTPDELMARLKSDITKWGAVMEKAKIPKK